MTTRACGAWLAALLTSCGGGTFETATELPTAPRRPDGVALEPAPVMPEPTDRAEARGFVALRVPISDQEVAALVRAYVEAFRRGDERALASLAAENATMLGRRGTRQPLLDRWRAKLKSHDYAELSAVEVARVARTERYTYETLGAPDTPARPSEMRRGDLYVRVPIVAPRGGSEQLFGDVLVLVLRREDGQLKIAAQADE